MLQHVADIIYVKQLYVTRLLCKAPTVAPRYARMYGWDTSVILSQRNVTLAGRHCTACSVRRRGFCWWYNVRAHSWWRLCLLECDFKRRYQLLRLYSVGGRWNERIRYNSGKIMAGGTRNSRRQMCPTATWSTINPTWADLPLNPSLRVERLASDRLSRRPLTPVSVRGFDTSGIRVRGKDITVG